MQKDGGFVNRKHILQLILGGLFCALFFVSSNILPPICIIPGVPVTLQIMVVTLTAAVLGLRGGLLTLATIYLMTAAGVPMMSGFSGGAAAFLKPTAGFIIGWVFLVLAVGLYEDLLAPRLRAGKAGQALYFAGFTAAGVLGVLLDYLCGAAFLAVYNGAPGALLPTFAATLVSFGLFDAAKIAGAAVLSAAAFAAVSKIAGHKSRA